MVNKPDWMSKLRKTVMLPFLGVEVEVRIANTLKMADFGPLPGIESADTKRGVEQGRRFLKACVVRIGDMVDPFETGILSEQDIHMDDVNAIMGAVVDLMPKREVVDDAVPLADTDSPAESPAS